MEFEKTLYRIHERALSVEGVQNVIKFVFWACLLLASICFPLFIYANVSYRGTDTCLAKGIDNYQTKYYPITTPADPSVTPVSMESNEQTVAPPSTIKGEPRGATANEIPQNKGTRPPTFNLTDSILNISVIRPGDDSNEEYTYLTMEYTQVHHLLSMKPEIRASHNFSVHNITVDVECLAGGFLSRMVAVYVIGLENILINQIISYKNATNSLIMLKNTDGGEMWGWSKEANDYYNAGFIVRTFWKVWSSLKIFLGMFLLSSITSIYIKMTIISAPLFIIAALRCNQQPTAETASAWLHIYRSFPWVGMYLYALSFQYRHLQKYILVAFGLMILVFYCVFLASVSIWGYLLFFKALPKGIDENFYGFVAFLELLILLFLRTRSTLKHYPIVANTIMFTFLLYVSQTQYGFYYLGLYNVIIAVVGFLAYNLIKFEIPALNWNMSHPHTPSIQKPRCLYFPAFSVSWVSDLPQLWTMFFPLVGRNAFNAPQMAFVDRDQQAMQQLMESHQNQEYPVEAQEAAHRNNQRQGDNSTANSQRELVADEASTNRSPGIPTANQNDSPSTSSPQINPGNHSILDIIQDHILPAHDNGDGLNERILNSPEDAAIRDMELGDPNRLVRPNNNNTTSSSSTGSGNSYQRLNN